MILAAVLLVRMLAPGIFFMWFGFAALATGPIVFRYEIGWQWQLVWFGGRRSSPSSWSTARKYPLERSAAQPARRATHRQTFELVDPIANGRGSVHAGDTIWRVEGRSTRRASGRRADGSI